MNFRFLSFKGEKPPKTAIAPVSAMPTGSFKGHPYDERWSVERAVTDGFERDLYVYKCAHQIATNEAKLPIVVGLRPNSEDVHAHDNTFVKQPPDDPFLHLLNVQANPLETGKDFRYRLGLQLLLSKKGVFVELIRQRDGTITELHLFPPDRMRPVPDPDNYVEYFELTVQNAWGRWAKYDVPKERVLWIKRPHPLNPYTGNTPMEAAGLSIDTDWYTRLYNYNFVRRDGRPQTLLGYKGDLSAADAKELERRYNAPGANGQVLSVVDNVENMVAIDLVKTPRDMQYKDLRLGTKEEVLMAFGVPESQLGNASGRTFDNADAEAVFFWAITMEDHNATLLDPFSTLRTSIHDDDLQLTHDISQVEPLQRLKRAERDEDRKDVTAGVRSPDEYREKWGEEAVGEPGTEALYMSSTMVPISGQAKKTADAAAAAKPPPAQGHAGGAAGGPGTDGGGPVPEASGTAAETPPGAPPGPSSNGAGAGAPVAGKRWAVIASQDLRAGIKVLIPGAEEAGLHRVRKVEWRKVSGKRVLALSVAGPLTNGERETLMYPPDVAFKFAEELHPRDEAGKFTEAGGGDGAGRPHQWSPQALSEAFDRSVVPLHLGAAKVTTLNSMLNQLRSGQPITLHPDDVNVFLDALAVRAKNGEDFDLNTVSVGGKPLFFGQVGEGGPEGPARVEMPQIPNEWKGEFLKELADKGVTAQDAEVPATALRPTQREISGSKVTGMMDSIEKGKLDLSTERTLVSNDGFVLDGHHRWAAVVGVDYEDGKPGDINIPVTVINQNIDQLLEEANKFVDENNIGRLAAGQSRKGYPWLFYRAPDYAYTELKALERKFDESLHPRGGDPANPGRFSHAEGGDGAHAVGVSLDPMSQSLHTVTGPRQPNESAEAFNTRVFLYGQEHYPPAAALDAGADHYRAERGLPDPKVQNWTGIQADWDRAERVGDAFATATSNPNDPEVRAAYEDLKAQTNEQWHLLTDPVEQGGMGIKVDFVSPQEIRDKYGDSEGLNPYPTAEAQRDDLVNNHHLAIASIADYVPQAAHPLLSNDRGGEYDQFRAVHDAFGHAAIGADFTRHGEFQAWIHHTSMFDGPAQLAASTELTGENCFLVTHHQAAEHKATLLDPDVLELDNISRLYGVHAPTKAQLSQMDSSRGGDPDVWEKFGVVNSHNALYAQIARNRKQ